MLWPPRSVVSSDAPTLRKPRTPPELLPRPTPLPSRPQHHGPAALGTDHAGALLGQPGRLEILPVHAGGGGRSFKTVGLDTVDDLPDLLLGQQGLLLGFDIAGVAHDTGHVGRHGGLELRFACEDHHRKDFGDIEAEERLDDFHMFVVLAQGVLKGVGVAVDLLGPARLVLAAKDPAFHVLGLHHEDPVAGDDEVIDLGGSLPVRKGHVTDEMVVPLIKQHLCGQVDDRLAGDPFEPGGFQDTEQNCNGTDDQCVFNNLWING